MPNNLNPPALTDGSSTGYRTVELHLETELKNFNPIKADFVAQLAATLKAGIEDLEIISIRSGCVRFTFRLPEAKADELERAMNSDPRPPELQAFLDRFSVDPARTGYDVFTSAPNIVSTNRISDELAKPGRVITWLHISDAHILKSNSGAASWSQDLVKEAFIASLPNLLAGWDLKPDLVFFTGDVTSSGRSEEYEAAKTFLSDLKKGLPGKPRIFIVPGNHDVTWDKISEKEDKSLRKLLASSPAVNRYLLDDQYRDRRVRDWQRLDSFFKFLADGTSTLGHPPLNEEYYYWDKLSVSGLCLGVAGLNSAWRSTRKDGAKRKPTNDFDQNNLILGEPQVIGAVKKLDDTQIRFALLHHPPDSMWFTQFDRKMQAAQLAKFDFILRGHEHETAVTQVNNINTDLEHIEIAAGALYDASELEGVSGYPICFNAVRINVDTGQGIIFYWRYFSEGYKWVRDILTDNGVKMFKLPEGLLKRLDKSPNGPSRESFGMSAGSK